MSLSSIPHSLPFKKQLLQIVEQRRPKAIFGLSSATLARNVALENERNVFPMSRRHIIFALRATTSRFPVC